ncbi:HEAT repeat domain-containing protein [Pseudalkalibacillus decolorationis]|uniref:HEAT repeat domain-containing protein n=1 Tax=Pseudalkalibacillus decolorationis TaxID=163879 RepID=UPI002147F62F|nr:HEAT repeat domain-containing protein [Pseudalkalibacillus decolorationis]
MNEWRETLKTFLHNDQWEEVITFIEKDKTKHAGTAPAQVKRKAIKLIESTYKNDQAKRQRITVYLGTHNSPTAKEISAHLLPGIYAKNPNRTTSLLKVIADDDNWEVREWAAGACGELLAKQFDEFYPILIKWVKSDSENVRRAVALAVMYASKALNVDYAARLIQVIEPLMRDFSVYVKKNLGPFAIGDGLMKRYPEQVLSWLKGCAAIDDEQVRWNVAMAFSTAASRSYATEGKAILSTLENDSRASVQRSVKKAQHNLEKAPAKTKKR